MRCHRWASHPSLTLSHLSGGDGELYDFAHATRKLRAGSTHGRALARAYAAAVAFVDAQVGRVLSALGARANSTLTLLVSDHGWKLGHAGGWGKHTLLAADTQVPLLIWAPGYVPRRRLESTPRPDLRPRPPPKASALASAL